MAAAAARPAAVGGTPTAAFAFSGVRYLHKRKQPAPERHWLLEYPRTGGGHGIVVDHQSRASHFGGYAQTGDDTKTRDNGFGSARLQIFLIFLVDRFELCPVPV
jgi:hypothetical protein